LRTAGRGIQRAAHQGLIATLVSVATLVIGSTTVLAALQSALEVIWGSQLAPPQARAGGQLVNTNNYYRLPAMSDREQRESSLQASQLQINHRCKIQREQLREHQAAHNGHAERAAHLGTRA
jgi:hypothetical protein